MEKCTITIKGSEKNGTVVSRVDFEIIKAFADLLETRGYKCEIQHFFIPWEIDVVAKNWSSTSANITNCVSL